MKNWRKVHIFSLGYFKLVSLISSSLLLIIGVTGILYNHINDFDFLREGRVPTSILPAKYQERLERTQRAQGLEEVFPEETASVPVMWVIIDLHNGAFFGGMAGRIFYDVLGGVLVVLSVTGVYMYFRLRHRKRW